MVSALACQAQLPHPLAGLGAEGGVSLPISAAQLPAVLILTALRVIHLVHAETFLEVLGPNLGIQDLLSHVAGEPASLLVVQTLTKDPPCTGRGRRGSGAPAGPWLTLLLAQQLSGSSQSSLLQEPLLKTLRLGLPPIF